MITDRVFADCHCLQVTCFVELAHGSVTRSARSFDRLRVDFPPHLRTNQTSQPNSAVRVSPIPQSNRTALDTMCGYGGGGGGGGVVL